MEDIWAVKNGTVDANRKKKREEGEEKSSWLRRRKVERGGGEDCMKLKNPIGRTVSKCWGNTMQ